MGRHSEKKSSSHRASNSKIITLLIIMFIIVVGAILLNKRDSNKTQVKTTINNALSLLKQVDSEKVNEYLEYEKLISGLDEMILTEDTDTAKQIQKKLFSNLSWNIRKVQIKDEKAIATIEVTNSNYKNIISNWMKEMVSQKAAKRTITNELALEKLSSTIDNEEENETVIKEITLTKVNDKWKIVVNDELRNLVFPGIESIVSALEEGV